MLKEKNGVLERSGPILFVGLFESSWALDVVSMCTCRFGDKTSLGGGMGSFNWKGEWHQLKRVKTWESEKEKLQQLKGELDGAK